MKTIMFATNEDGTKFWFEVDTETIASAIWEEIEWRIDNELNPLWRNEYIERCGEVLTVDIDMDFDDGEIYIGKYLKVYGCYWNEERDEYWEGAYTREIVVDVWKQLKANARYYNENYAHYEDPESEWNYYKNRI